MAIDYRVFKIRKPERRKVVQRRKARADGKKLKAFRDAVWAREAVGDPIYGWGRCQHCGIMVDREGWNCFGEVHHRISRRQKATRYEPSNGVLLCGYMGNNCHEKAQRHEIEV